MSVLNRSLIQPFARKLSVKVTVEGSCGRFSLSIHRATAWCPREMCVRAILPLGETSACAAGVNVRKARGAIVIATALMTGAATIVIGPLSFVGLVAPHLVRAMGIARALPQMCAAALAGGAILVLADWIGRLLIFPWQIPAGLLAALVGGPYFLVLMWRRP